MFAELEGRSLIDALRARCQNRTNTMMRRSAESSEESFKHLALAIAVAAVRNSSLEDLHAGQAPDSEVGDFSDVKVVTPYGEIPWPELSRLNDEEMKVLMKQVVNRLYTCLHFLLTDPDDERFHRLIDHALGFTSGWDEPAIDDALIPSVVGGPPSE